MTTQQDTIGPYCGLVGCNWLGTVLIVNNDYNQRIPSKEHSSSHQVVDLAGVGQ